MYHKIIQKRIHLST